MQMALGRIVGMVQNGVTHLLSLERDKLDLLDGLDKLDNTVKRVKI